MGDELRQRQREFNKGNDWVSKLQDSPHKESREDNVQGPHQHTKDQKLAKALPHSDRHPKNHPAKQDGDGTKDISGDDIVSRALRRARAAVARPTQMKMI